MSSFDEVAAILHRGGIIAYPTEAVFGLGCDPSREAAVVKVLQLKQRPIEKGLIVIAATVDQLYPFIAKGVFAQFPDVLQSWPGPNTWLLPCKKNTPKWLTGEHDTLAVRVTAHPIAAALCRAFNGPLVSTSANPSNKEPARNKKAVETFFPSMLDIIVDGEVNVEASVSSIRDARNGQLLR